MKKLTILTTFFILTLCVCVSVTAEQGTAGQAKTASDLSNASPPASPTVADTLTDLFTHMEFVLVKGGCFCMGDITGDSKPYTSVPARAVCVDDFYLSKYEVTQAQWRAIMGSNPAGSVKCGDDCPVVEVSWNDTQAFIADLNMHSSKNYRLPTEAEWEYAARNGEMDDECQELGQRTQTSASPAERSAVVRSLRPVGQSAPNKLGIHDMMGNVWEWTSDSYGGRNYFETKVINPTGPSDGRFRALRGGSWLDNPTVMRASFRIRYEPSVQRPWIGFRLLLPVENGIKRYDKSTLEKLSCTCTKI